jgi:hypothetical protein
MADRPARVSSSVMSLFRSRHSDTAGSWQDRGMPAFPGGPAWPELDVRLARHDLPVRTARAALVRGRVAEADSEPAAAIHAYETGLRALSDADWPLLRADLRLSLGRLLATTDSPAEHHVSAILTKLRLRSRAEVAVYAASRDMVAPTMSQ